MLEGVSAADSLRNQLRGILSELDEEIRTAFPVSCCELERKTFVAEVSVVKDLVGFVKDALTGEAPAQDARFLSHGQACDLRDSLLICARDIRIEREKREAQLAALKARAWSRGVGEAFQQLIDDEQRVCDHLTASGAFDQQRATALRTVAVDLSDICLKALSQAASLSHPSEQRLKQLGREAYLLAERATVEWLSWVEQSIKRKEAHWARCPSVLISRLLSEAAASERTAGEFLTAVRTSMRLRRQQLRLLSTQQRLSAVLATHDILDSLRRNVLLPSCSASGA
jgi:hypothetical protein